MKIYVFILCISYCIILNAQVTTIWKNGVISTYVIDADSIVFEEDVDLSKFPPKLNSITYIETETNYIFSVEIKSIINLPISNYGWEISNNNVFTDPILAKELNEAIIAMEDGILKLAIPKDYVKSYLCNQFIRAYASHTFEPSYSTYLKISEEFLRLKWDGTVNKNFTGGNGTYLSPYLIANGGDLALISNYPNKYFIMINDIDLNNVNWTPIPNFNGTFDGNNKVIKNLSIDHNDNKIGLFSETLPQSNIKNITIEGININCPSSSYVGAIAGIASGNYSSCSVDIKDGIILGNEYVGGMFGQILHDGSYKESFSFNNCKVVSNIDKPHILGNSTIGGFAGSTSVRYYNYLVNISNIHTSSSLKGQSYVGGLFGKLQSFVYLDRSKSTCHLVGEENLGGIAGEISSTVESKCLISSCISDCNIEGNNRIGGFAGTLGCFPIVSSYTKGRIISEGEYIGGFIGYNEYVYQSSTNFELCYNAINLPSHAAGFSGYVERTIIYKNCYTNAQKYYNKKGSSWIESLKIINCKKDCQNSDIVDGIVESSSSYINNWNLSSHWVWDGRIDFNTITLTCPKLIWE